MIKKLLCFLIALTLSASLPFVAPPAQAGAYLQTYTEGSFTPVIAFGGASVGVTYSTQQGRYTRIGRMVFGQLEITLTSKGSSVGAATITGLPFTSAVAPRSVSNGLFVTMTNTETVIGQVGASGTSITLFVTNAGTTTTAADTNFQNTTTLQISFFYMV